METKKKIKTQASKMTAPCTDVTSQGGNSWQCQKLRNLYYLKDNKKSSVNEVQLHLTEKSPRFLNNYNVNNIVFFKNDIGLYPF